VVAHLVGIVRSGTQATELSLVYEQRIFSLNTVNRFAVLIKTQGFRDVGNEFQNIR
jgi:hypothetical protein